MNVKEFSGLKFLFLLAGAVLFCTGCAEKIFQDRVCYRERCFHVELAVTPLERQRGLQFRKQLAADQGMLFVFPSSGRHAFWMKDTLIPLDMIWLDYNRRVVHLESHVPPCQKDPCPSYPPRQNAMYVLEVAAGQAALAGITLGEELRFQLRER